MILCKGTMFLLKDSADSYYTDLIVFEKQVDKKDIIKTIENVKTQKEDYTNEDIYEALDSLGEYYIMWLGNLDTYEY